MKVFTVCRFGILIMVWLASGACKKSTSDPVTEQTRALLQNKWQLVTHITNYPNHNNQPAHTATYNGMPEDFYLFTKDSAVCSVMNNASVPGSGSDTASYTFIDNHTIELRYPSGPKVSQQVYIVTIELLTTDRLILTYTQQITDGSGPSAVTYTAASRDALKR